MWNQELHSSVPVVTPRPPPPPQPPSDSPHPTSPCSTSFALLRTFRLTDSSQDEARSELWCQTTPPLFPPCLHLHVIRYRDLFSFHHQLLRGHALLEPLTTANANKARSVAVQDRSISLVFFFHWLYAGTNGFSSKGPVISECQ